MTALITAVNVRLLSAKPDEPIAMSFGVLERRSMAFVEVRCSDGTFGYGESWTNHPSWAGEERQATIMHGLAPLIIGRDADAVVKLQSEMFAKLEPIGRQWGAPGPVAQAISGVDIALWDRYARSVGAPLYKVFGGAIREEVPIYASGLGPGRVAELAQSCAAAGYRLVKLKVGFGYDVDVNNLAVLRDILGDDVAIAVDANQRWSLQEALAIGGALRDVGVAWVEEPLVGNQITEIEAFYRSTGLPVALGENLYRRAAFEPYIASPAITVIQPDVSKSGGITEIREICESAARAGKTVIPHLYGGAPAFAATMQLAAVCEAIEYVEYDVRSNPLRDPLLCGPPAPNRGVIRIPSGPGLGVRFDQEAIDLVTDEFASYTLER